MRGTTPERYEGWSQRSPSSEWSGACWIADHGLLGFLEHMLWTDQLQVHYRKTGRYGPGR
jgi:hypothetical protein